MKKCLLIIIVIFSLSTYIFAAEMSTAGYYNLKNMALGNSYFTNEATDMALFTNPALMGMITDGKFTLVGFSSGTNDEGKDVQDTIMDIADEVGKDEALSAEGKIYNGKKFSELSETEILKYMQDKQLLVKGKSYKNFGKFNSFAYTGKHFGTGIYMSEVINDGQIATDPTGAPKIILNGVARMEIPVGLAFNFGAAKQIHVGASLRYMNFIKFDTNLGATDLMSFSNDSGEDKDITDILDATLNHGLGLNLGVAYSFSKFNTTVGLGLQDAWSSVQSYALPSDVQASDIFSGGSDKIGTYSLPSNLRLGVTTQPLNWLEVTGEVDNLMSKNLDGIADTREDDLYKKIHFGTEASPLKFFPNLNKILDLRLRMGVNQGYFTYGTGISVLFINFEYAHFTEEAGYTAGMDPNPIDAFSLFVRF